MDYQKDLFQGFSELCSIHQSLVVWKYRILKICECDVRNYAILAFFYAMVIAPSPQNNIQQNLGQMKSTLPRINFAFTIGKLFGAHAKPWQINYWAPCRCEFYIFRVLSPHCLTLTVDLLACWRSAWGSKLWSRGKRRQYHGKIF
jgi:hypothetical protein